ncbi:uncharacterized protein KY384_004963 [Bacidia gigantensis]|uniref:uncharacterized protein n=1 Tax=Bacidia gigantensis TaxID=2732470 RepID=UPI001D04EA0F|nr:uncharacterized protein KY384_004963 [Bacidia gigantensis]KAG8530460.1 hypothetical protein KY384_004963 [Bacidia gigantensis]
MLVVGRFINGLCVGIASAQVPVYIAELAPPSKRGRLVGCQQWAITWDDPGHLSLPRHAGLTGIPRWLARQDRWEDCHHVLTLVHGKRDPNSPFVARELQEIKDMCQFERQNGDVTFLELFKPNMIWRTHIGVFTQIWSQLTGMNVMMLYIVYVFAMAGLKGSNLLVSSSIQYVINVFLTVPALLYIDRWGRRNTLMLGSLGMMTMMFANAGLMASYGTYAGPKGVDNVPEASWRLSGPPSKAVIACTYLFVACYAPSWGPVSWIYPPELYPLRVRGKAVALTTSSNWIFNFALTYFVPPAFVNIQWKVYLIFGVFNAAMLVHVFFAFPETAGKTLEEVEDMFTDPNGIKGIGTPAWKTRKAYGKARLLERGELDSEKAAAIERELSGGSRSGSDTKIETTATKVG